MGKPVIVQINNTLKDSDSTSVHDRYLLNSVEGTWNPQTFYPGESSTTQLKNWFSFNLSNPPTSSYPSSTNVYFWINDGKLNSYSPANYGFSVTLGSDQKLYVNDVSPGTIDPSGGIGKRFVSFDGTFNFNIYNTKDITITNATSDDLPYFVNYILPQPFPTNLTDFPASSSTGTVAKGATYSTKAYNVSGAKPNCGIYFYANGALPTDPAIAVASVGMIDSAVSNLNSTSAKVTNSRYAFTVGDPGSTTTSSSSNTSSSGSSKKVWIWVGVAIGVIALIVIIALIIHFTNKKAPTSSSYPTVT
jgi:hypothetical protein